MYFSYLVITHCEDLSSPTADKRRGLDVICQRPVSDLTPAPKIHSVSWLRVLTPGSLRARPHVRRLSPVLLIPLCPTSLKSVVQFPSPFSEKARTISP